MEIEPADYDAVVAQAKASVAAARAVLDNLENQKAYQRGVIAQAEAQRLSALARLLETQQEQERQSALLRSQVGTPQKVEQATSAYETARAALTASEATIDAQRRQLDVLNGQQGLLVANRDAAEAALKTAELRLGYTRIVAPFDGVVGERHVQEGDYVNVGTQLIAVVPLPNVYVTANYKETQLTHVAAGQPVDVTVDTFPDAVLHGHVARLSPASGSTFALLPPDNATGNFTKVVQRIPVRVEFDPGQPLVEQLRPGMSVVTRIRVTEAAGRCRTKGSLRWQLKRSAAARSPSAARPIIPCSLSSPSCSAPSSSASTRGSSRLGLPDLRGALGLTFDEGSWLSTAATAPQILIAPAIAWLATVFGLRRVLVGPSLVYIAVSVLIPFVRDYQTLLVLHFIHGLLLGVFVPVTIMIVLRNLPMKWWIVGLAAYSFRLSFTGNAGVSLVGFYVQHLGWQWLYWQDAVIALLMVVLTLLGTPRESINHQLLAKADWGGMLLFGAGLALIYTGLDQGNRLDWFESGTVTALIAGGAALVVCFLINEAVVAEPWASPTVLMSRNVLLTMSAMVTYMVTSLSNTMLVPTFLTTVAGLRPEQTGSLLLVYTALPICIVVLVAIYLLRRIDARFVAMIGLTSFAIAALMGTRITGAWAPDDFIPMALLQSVGQGLTFTALLIFVLSNSNPARATAFVAYIQVMRLNFIEITATAMSTFLRVREQVHSNLVGLHVSAGDSEVAQRFPA